jgi:phage RecT family recombinase
MSQTATAEVADAAHYDDIPGAAPSHGALVAAQKWEDFQTEVKARESDFAAMLPPHVRKDRFIAAAIAAVKQNPDLLFADKRTLFSALVKAAQDGLLPDGREGIINIYNTEVTKGKWIKQAQWNPMIYGLRKRARELDAMLIDAQVVYANDDFLWQQGDDPKIEHTPAKLGTPRGEMIGAYAIYKREDKTVLHREVMDKTQITTTRNQSKAPNSLMWTKFETEGWRKTVVRRGIKSVPVSESLEQIVRRDDDMFDFNQATIEPPAPKLSPPPAPKAPSAPKAEQKPIDVPPPHVAGTLPGDWQQYLDRQKDEFEACTEAMDKQSVCDAVTDTLQAARERGEISGEEQEAISEAWDSMVG